VPTCFRYGGLFIDDFVQMCRELDGERILKVLVFVMDLLVEVYCYLFYSPWPISSVLPLVCIIYILHSRVSFVLPSGTFY